MLHVIDLNFQGKPKSIAAFLLETSDGPILFETGPYSCIETLHRGIRDIGYEPSAIKHVFLTHIHLDHGGAAWSFAESGAKIYLHPFGHRHLMDPSRFIASAKMIYQEKMDSLWGEIKPIAEERLQVVQDQEEIVIGDVTILAHHTPGHAKHHIAWQIGEHLIAGDLAGVAIDGGPIIPPCPPPDIDIELWKASIEKVLNHTEIKTYFLSHFGRIDETVEHMHAMLDSLDAYATFIKPFAEQDRPLEEVIGPFEKFVVDYLIKNGATKEVLATYETANPSFMGVAGLIRYWKKHGLQKAQP